MTVRIVFAIFLLLILAAALACDPGATITYVNTTDTTVLIYTGDDRDLSEYDVIVQPHSAVKAGTIEIEFKGVVIVRDQAGNTLLREEITWAQLKAQDHFVITTDMLSPIPTATVPAPPSPQ